MISGLCASGREDYPNVSIGGIAYTNKCKIWIGGVDRVPISRSWRGWTGYGGPWSRV